MSYKITSEKDYPFVSIIVVNYNGKRWIDKCFKSLEEIDYPKDRYEVIMGDNTSTDDSVEYTKKNFPWVRILQFDKNYGFCKGNNLCAKEAKGEYLVFLNDDTFVDKKWLKELIKGVISEKEVICCACKMLVPNLIVEGKYIINTVGGTIFPDGGFYNGFLELDAEKYNKPQYVGFACGAGVLIKKDFFLSTNGFDEYYYFTVEEIDLGLRVWRYGYKVLYVPSAIMWHFGGGSDSFEHKAITSPSLEFIITRNRIYFILKNFEFSNIIKGFVLLFIKSLAMIIYSLVNRNINIPLSVIRAYVCGLEYSIKGRKKIIEQRKIIQKNKKRTDSELYKIGVIGSVRKWFLTHINAMKRKEEIRGGVFSKEDAVKIKKIKDHVEFYKV